MLFENVSSIKSKKNAKNSMKKGQKINRERKRKKRTNLKVLVWRSISGDAVVYSNTPERKQWKRGKNGGTIQNCKQEKKAKKKKKTAKYKESKEKEKDILNWIADLEKVFFSSFSWFLFILCLLLNWWSVLNFNHTMQMAINQRSHTRKENESLRWKLNVK